MRFIYIIMTILLFGCASTLRVPLNSYLRPENISEDGGALESFFGKSATLQGAQDTRTTPINGTVRIDESATPGLQGQFGLLDFMDLYWRWNPGGPNLAGLKLQILGDNQPSAKAGNFSLSLAGGFAIYVAGAETFDSLGNKRKYLVEYSSPQAELLFGFRPFDQILLYSGYSYAKFTYSLTFREGARDQFNYQGTHKILHFGGMVNAGGFFASADLANSQLVFADQEKSTLSYGLNAGVVW